MSGRGGSGRGGSGRGASGRAREAARQAAEQAARRRRDRRLLLLAVVAVLVIVVGGGLGLQAYRTHKAPEPVTPAAPVSDAQQQLTSGQPIRLGRADAPVTVALYEDFHCPHCAEFEEEFGPTLTAAQRAGSVQVALYPMSFIDTGSTAAANAMACSAQAGFGQANYLGLFGNHTLQWSDRQLVDLAGKVGGRADGGFAGCVTGRAQAGWVDSINATASTNGVTATPTMFLDGAPLPIDGLTPARLQADIDQAVQAAAK